MRKIVYDTPYIIYGTPDTLNAIDSFCANGSIGRIYSRFYEMSSNQREGKRLESLMNSLGFTGTSNAFANPPVYEAKQWFGYEQDEEMINQLLIEIGA